MSDEKLKRQLSLEKRKLIEKYESYKYEFLGGFCKCEIYDMEFLKHKPSNKMIDIRNLKEIKNIEEFKDFCAALESLET